MSLTISVLLIAILFMIMPFIACHYAHIKDHLAEDSGDPVMEMTHTDNTFLAIVSKTDKGNGSQNDASESDMKRDEYEIEQGQSEPAKTAAKGKAPSLSVAMRHYFKHYHCVALKKLPFKVAVLVLSAVMFGIALWAMLSELQIGLSLKELSNKGSYQYEFTDVNDKFSGYSGKIVSKQSSWASAAIQSQSKVQDDAIATSTFVSQANPIHQGNWLYNASKSLIGTGSFNDNIYVVTGSFSPFTQWMYTSGALYENFMICHTTDTSGTECLCTDSNSADRRIKAAYHVVVFTGLSTTQDFVDMIEETRKLADAENKIGNDAYLYGTPFVYWEQYLNIHERLWVLSALCIAGITVLNMFLQVSFRAAALTCLILVIYVVEMMGSLALMSIKLNAFSLVNIVVSIGFTV